MKARPSASECPKLDVKPKIAISPTDSFATEIYEPRFRLFEQKGFHAWKAVPVTLSRSTCQGEVLGPRCFSKSLNDYGVSRNTFG